MKSVFVLVALLSLVGCAVKSEPVEQDEAQLATAITHVEGADGVTTTKVDARANDKTIYLDLGWKTEVFPTAPATSATWDLSFSRFTIKSNSGSSGPGNVGIASLPAGTSFDAVTVAPSTGYAADTAEVAALGAWYNYDMATHTLSAADTVFVVRTVGGEYFKVKFTGYYDTAATPGYPQFRWAPIAAPVSN